MERINIAELLKNCPKGMELDCLMYEDVYFDYVDELNIIHGYIQYETYKTSLTFTQHGTPNSDIKSKCIIFPKGKTTWEGFVPPCKFKNGDVVAVTITTGGIWAGIFKQYNEPSFESHCCLSATGVFSSKGFKNHSLIGLRLATEEEKHKLFQAIKDNGYHWNEETKTLEKLVEPKLKVGDRIKKGGKIATIERIHRNFYDVKYDNGIGSFTIDLQDECELFPNKFDISTLKPFKSKVLVRHNKDNKWCASFFSHIDVDLHSNCYKFVTIAGKSYPMMIPYEGNEHLLGTSNDCDEYYKTWK